MNRTEHGFDRAAPGSGHSRPSTAPFSLTTHHLALPKNVLSILAGLALWASAGATSYSPLTLTQQAKKAEVIVQATIQPPTSVMEDGLSYNVYPLKLSATLAGDAGQLPQLGGVPALYVLNSVDGAPVFQSGQEAVLLLYKGRLDSPLVGFNQGVYWLVNGQIVSGQLAGGQLVPGSQPNASGPRNPEELRAAIVAARAGQ